MMSTAAYKPVLPAKARILVVEDDADHYITEAQMIKECGVPARNIEWRISGEGVVQFADILAPLDVILLDIGLLHEDGYEVLRKLRAIQRFNYTRIVAVSGRRDEMERAKAAGFDSFIGKPLTMERFPGQLARILKGEQVWEDR